MQYSNWRIITVGSLLAILVCRCGVAQDDLEGVLAKKQTLMPGKLEYFLIGSSEKLKMPERGYKLLIVLPGDDGSADFSSFIQNIYKNALDDDFLVIQLVAPKWNASQKIVWPTMRDKVPGKKVPVEMFISRAVDDVKKRARIDERHVYTLSWSSGGPAAYAASLTKDTPITGSFVAMSVFYPATLPNLKLAKGKPYYIFHSKEDNVCKYPIAVRARDTLREAGAVVEFAEYSGGHGWYGDVFGNIRKGVEWLEKQNEE